MDKLKKREELLLRIIHLISQKYKNKAILKGGMYLRLLNSPRYTQDVDYIFITNVSRKIIAKQIKELLEKKNKIRVENTNLNSRGVFMDVRSEDSLAQIEISIKKTLNVPAEQMTTSALADTLNIPAQIITVMSRSEAYAHKIAAALERKSLRDLYDISIYEPQTEFDEGTLKRRLSKLVVDRKKPITLSFSEASHRLKKRILDLDQHSLENQLTGLVPDKFFKGGLDIIKMSLSRLCQKLEQGN